MTNIINTFNEIVWPSSTFFIWMISIMYVHKKKGRKHEYVLALFVISVFMTYATFCFYQRKSIGVNIPLSVGLICGLLFLFDKKKQKNINKTDMKNVSAGTKTIEKIIKKSKPGREIDSRTIFDFIIGKNISDNTTYIENLKDKMKGRKGQKALEECFLKEMGTNISKTSLSAPSTMNSRESQMRQGSPDSRRKSKATSPHKSCKERSFFICFHDNLNNFDNLLNRLSKLFCN